MLHNISNHSISFKNCDAFVGIGTQVRAYFYVYPGQLINSHGQYFLEKGCMIWRSGSQIQTIFSLQTYRAKMNQKASERMQ